MQFKNLIKTVALGLFVTACDSDIKDLEPLIPGDYQSGILVSNEGPFNNGTGTVSFIPEDLSAVENTIYKSVNNEDIGNVVQSIAFGNGNAYIVANVSNTISVVNRFTFEKIATISNGLNNPRYFVYADGKGYVSNWGDAADETDDYIAIINLETNAVEGSIPVAFGPEKIAVRGAGGKIYVAHQGGFGQNDKVSVISVDTNEVTTSITVGDVPNSMEFDIEGNLWVLCGGKPSFTADETPGSLYKIDTTDDSASKVFDFEATAHPNHFNRSENAFYFALDGAVFKLDFTATTLPTESEFSGLSIYSMTTSADRLYTTDAKDFASNGSLSIYDLSSKEEIKTLEVGLIPGGIYFN